MPSWQVSASHIDIHLFLTATKLLTYLDEMAEENSMTNQILVRHMPQQIHAWTPDDDWTGVVDRKERRKLQNRQNQRKWSIFYLSSE